MPAHKINGELIPLGGGDSIPLARSPLVPGRRESCDICLQFPHISGAHCELSYKEGLWILRDLDSKNGTLVNDIRMDAGTRKIIILSKPAFCPAAFNEPLPELARLC